jgi:hypothetical protein
MNKKHGLLFGFAVKAALCAAAIAAIFTLAGCPTDSDDSGNGNGNGGGNPKGTIKLTQTDDQKGENKFSVELTGLTWVEGNLYFGFDFYSLLDLELIRE